MRKTTAVSLVRRFVSLPGRWEGENTVQELNLRHHAPVDIFAISKCPHCRRREIYRQPVIAHPINELPPSEICFVKRHVRTGSKKKVASQLNFYSKVKVNVRGGVDQRLVSS